MGVHSLGLITGPEGIHQCSLRVIAFEEVPGKLRKTLLSPALRQPFESLAGGQVQSSPSATGEFFVERLPSQRMIETVFVTADLTDKPGVGCPLQDPLDQ